MTAPAETPQPAAPLRWQGSEEESSLWNRLPSLRRNAGRALLMLDYDGTLAPFADDPLEAYPYAGVGDRLRVLAHSPAVRLVIISGRTVAGVRRLLPEDVRGVEIWGNHGWERRLPDGGYRLDRLTADELETIETVRRRIERLGYSRSIDLKPASIAVHWRALDAEDSKKIRAEMEELDRNRPPSRLRLVPFDGGLELRSIEPNKGTAIHTVLAEEAEGAPAAFLGDDLTDEDGFRAIAGRGIGILVRPEPRETAARYWIKPPEELLSFLDSWIASIR